MKISISVTILLYAAAIGGICDALEIASSTETQPFVMKLCSNLGFDALIVEDNTTTQNPDGIYCRCKIAIDVFRIEIECEDNQFNNTNFQAELLPVFTQLLDISWNHFEYLPVFVGEDLRILIASHNQIRVIDDQNIVKVPQLQVLDLSFNKIEALSVDAFKGLSVLTKLDLSRNLLRVITVNVFSNLPRLTHLNLSRNRHLNDTFSVADTDLFLTLGVTPKLKILEIEECDLDFIDISGGTGLEIIGFKYNNFSKIPEIPRGVRRLDFSGNPIESLHTKFLPNLEEFYLTDMPNLTAIEAYALFGLPKLRLLTFEGSWNLGTFDTDAFGTKEVLNVTDTNLEELILRGTNFKTLNSSVGFAKLRVLDLAGTPLICNCDLKWIVESELETNAECKSPAAVRGQRLSAVTIDDLKCKRWSGWVYQMLNGLLVLLLLVMCGVATWLIVTGIRPSRRGQLQKVGALSPYAPVTIQPNRAEDLH